MNLGKYIKKPYLIPLGMQNHGMGWIVPDALYLKCKFYNELGYRLNLKAPSTFNEKLQWLKLYDRRPIYTKMVDKYEVKQYVADIIGEEFIIPTLGVWDEFDDIDFEALPDQFVLKCTHDSGGLVICKDKSKFDVDEARTKIQGCLDTDYYLLGREWPYKNVRRRIIAEAYLADEFVTELKDYKLMCFNGCVKCTFVCSERYSSEGLKVTFFDREWNQMPFERHYPASMVPIVKPRQYEKMIELAEKIGADIPFVRVDFYEMNGQIFFGEITLYPGCGFEEFIPAEWDYILGEWILL